MHGTCAVMGHHSKVTFASYSKTHGWRLQLELRPAVSVSVSLAAAPA